MAAAKTSKSKSSKRKVSAPRAKQTAVPDLNPADMAKWQAEDDMRILQRAAIIQADPKRKAAAARMAAEEVKALQKIQKM